MEQRRGEKVSKETEGDQKELETRLIVINLVATHDILIAGICIANDLPLYTKNTGHFSEIKDLRLLSASEILAGR